MVQKYSKERVLNYCQLNVCKLKKLEINYGHRKKNLIYSITFRSNSYKKKLAYIFRVDHNFDKLLHNLAVRMRSRDLK